MWHFKIATECGENNFDEVVTQVFSNINTEEETKDSSHYAKGVQQTCRFI